MARVGRSIIFKVKAADGKVTSASIDDILADLFCIKKDNILCDGKGVTLLRKWCQSKIDQYNQGKEGVSAFLRRQMLLELIDLETAKVYVEKDYERVFRE